MRRTSIALLIALGFVGGIVGWLAQMALASGGDPSLTPPVTLVVALFAIAVILLALGWPIRQVVRGKRPQTVDPFFATRVLVFAKASSLTGALLTGLGAGLVLYAVTRAALPVLPGVWADALTLVAAAVLLAAGLIVENWCRIPPEDREQTVRQAMERR